MSENFKHNEITALIIKAFYHVYNVLGYGFLEKVYEKALILELRKSGLQAASQVPLKVFYEGTEVGNYFADIIVNECVIIELKAGEGLVEEHEAQLINYLRATNIEVGLLLIFGIKPQFKRKVFSNQFKTLE